MPLFEREFSCFNRDNKEYENVPVERLDVVQQSDAQQLLRISHTIVDSIASLPDADLQVAQAMSEDFGIEGGLSTIQKIFFDASATLQTDSLYVNCAIGISEEKTVLEELADDVPKAVIYARKQSVESRNEKLFYLDRENDMYVVISVGNDSNSYILSQSDTIPVNDDELRKQAIDGTGKISTEPEYTPLEQMTIFLSRLSDQTSLNLVYYQDYHPDLGKAKVLDAERTFPNGKQKELFYINSDR